MYHALCPSLFPTKPYDLIVAVNVPDTMQGHHDGATVLWWTEEENTREGGDKSFGEIFVGGTLDYMKTCMHVHMHACAQCTCIGCWVYTHTHITHKVVR